MAVGSCNTDPGSPIPHCPTPSPWPHTPRAGSAARHAGPVTPSTCPSAGSAHPAPLTLALLPHLRSGPSSCPTPGLTLSRPLSSPPGLLTPHHPQPAQLNLPWGSPGVCRGLGARAWAGEKPQGKVGPPGCQAGHRPGRESAWPRPPGGGRCPREQPLAAAFGERRPALGESREAPLRAGPPVSSCSLSPVPSVGAAPSWSPPPSPPSLRGGRRRGGSLGGAAFWKRPGLPACRSLG